ncbi:FCD domain-containing protein [uncultured Roseobacter sp.]|uniref:FadR/GntR family transcriptional regulator n=1 Tax=uncultured Roseobacter sp. TaxID=114847 RepID=UPI00261D0C50|nr:FCD domain-containing protein [uncultured Roseobacter sp.]
MDAQTLLAEDGTGRAHVPRRSMKETIADKLATLIASGVLSVGDELPAERDLASVMGVSRETIRGALLILSTRGILTVVQGARTTVASIDVGEMALSGMLYRDVMTYGLDEVHEARLLIEARIARLAAAQIETSALDRLSDLIAAQEAAGADPVRFLISDREFHTVVYRACGNGVLSDVATTLYAYLLDHRRRVIARPGAIQTSISDHRAIHDALARRDADAVAAAFAVHERRIYETTRQIMPKAGTAARPTNGGGKTP